MKVLLTIIAIAAACAMPYSASAQEYAHPTFQNITKSLIRFGAINIMKDDEIADDYAIVNECDLYFNFHENDFKWHKIRRLMRQSIRDNVATFPTSFYYDSKLQLGNYDFKEKRYSFSKGTTQKNVNTFTLNAENDSGCGSQKVTALPTKYRMVLDQTMYIPGLPLSEKEGEALLARMKEAGNTDRLVYVRFEIRVLYIAPLSRAATKEYGPAEKGPLTQGNTDGHVHMDSRLDRASFYEDEQMTKLIYDYRP